MNARVIVGSLVAVAVLGAVVWWQRAPEHRQHVVAAVTPTQQVSPVNTVREACALATGASFGFSYRSHTTYSITAELPGATTPVPQTGDVELTGRLAFEVLTATPQGATLVGRLTGTNDAARRKATDALENAFLAQVNERCEVVAYARLKSTPSTAARAQQVALTDLAFSVGDGSDASVANFQTSLGTLRALVTRGEGPGRFVRRPLNYTSRWSPRMAGVELIDGVVNVTREASPWFSQLSGVEEVAGGQVNASKTEWNVVAVAPEASVLAAASRDESDYVWENALAVSPVAESKLGAAGDDHAKRVEAARGVTWDQAMNRFGALLESGANINDQWRDMAAYLDAHPEQIETFAETVTDPAFPAGGKAPAFLALGQAQTHEARDVLLGIYRERETMSMGDRIRSSLALAGRVDVGAPLAKELRAEATRRPNTETEAAVSRQALLHLGVLSGSHADQPEIVQEALELAGQLTASARTPADYSVLCGMVGNMAELALLPQIASWSRLPDPAIRQHVPHALRRYHVDRVHDLVVEWLGRESDPGVKRELFNVLHHMYVDANKPIDAALVQEAIKHLKEAPLPLTRQSLYHLLAPHMGNPEVHELFKTQLKVELAERSGLYSLVAQDLPAASVNEVLSTLEAVKGQYGGSLKPEEPARPQAPMVDEPPGPPAGFEAAMRGAP